MRSDARKRIAEATTEALRASLGPGYTEGRQSVINELRTLLNGRATDTSGWPALIPLSDLYTIVGDPTTWPKDPA